MPVSRPIETLDAGISGGAARAWLGNVGADGAGYAWGIAGVIGSLAALIGLMS